MTNDEMPPRTANLHLKDSIRSFVIRHSSFVICLALCSAAYGDLILVQKVEGGGQSGEQTIRIKDGKSRADLAEALSILTDKATGDAVTLKHADRTFMKVPAAQSQSMLEAMRQKRGDAPPAELKATGKKEKVGAHDCEVFTADLGGLTVTYWIAKDFPNFAAIQQQLSAVQTGPLALGPHGLLPDATQFPGMTMKTEMVLSGKKVSITTVSVRESPVSDTLFTVPAGYKEMPTPELKFEPK